MTEENKPLLNESIHFDKQSDSDTTCTPIITQKKTFYSYYDSLPFTYKHAMILIASVMIYFSQSCQFISYNILIPVLRTEFSSSNKNLITSISSIIFIGFLVGTLFVGKCTEKLSRRKGILIALSSITFFGITITIFESLITIFICRMIIGFFLGMMIPQVLSNLFETLPNNDYKELLMFSVFIFGRLGYVYFLSVYPLFEGNWRVSFVLAVSPMIITLFISVLFFTDSLKLLYNKQQIDSLINEINIYNDIRKLPPISNEEAENLKVESELFLSLSKDKNDFSYMMLFKPIYLKSTILFIIMTTFSAMVSLTNIYTLPLIFSSNNAEYNISNMIITQCVTIPAVVFAAISSKFLGRKSTIIIGFSMCFFFSLLPFFYSKSFVIASSIINFFVMFIICTVRLFVMEIYPTKLRDISLAVVYAIAMIGEAITPFLSDFSMGISLIRGTYVQINLLSFIGLVASIIISSEKKNE